MTNSDQTNSKQVNSEQPSSEQPNSKQAKQAQNALLHGIYARDLVLPWESEDEFSKLHGSIQAELNPAGPLEDQVIFDITRLHWLKRRVVRASQIDFYSEPASPKLAELARKGVSEIEDHLRDQAKEREGLRREAQEATAKVVKMMAKVALAVDEAQQKGGSSKESIEATTADFEVLHKAAEGQLRLLESVGKSMEIFNIDKEVYRRAYRPTELERIIKVESMIDARIEKALARLAGLRQFRKMYSVKALEPPA